MPRFVILEHDWPHRHWDLLLQFGDVLRAWRLESPPTPGSDVRASANVDHRLHYLDYEGPVSGNRGHVKRWDAGEFEILDEREDELRIRCVGTRLNGEMRLKQLNTNDWRVVGPRTDVTTSGQD
jgi:DNA polymerase Ligase (LigD)